MARPLRINYEGALHHITVRGNERKKIFLSKADYERFLSLLKENSLRYGIILRCYVLMGNHYHLAVETPHGLLSRFMHDINSGYTTYFNVKRKRSGHLFQGRFKSLLVDKDSYLLELSRYIHLNPVRAGIVQKPEDFHFSSYRAYIFPDEFSIVSRERIWGMISSGQSSASDAYRRFVAEGMDEAASPFEKVYGGMILGSKRFIKESLARIKEESVQKHETSRKDLLSGVPPDIHEIVSHLASRYAISEERIVSATPYRHYAVYLARMSTPLSNADIGRYFCISVSGVTKIVTRLTARAETDVKMKKELTRLQEELSLVNG